MQLLMTTRFGSRSAPSPDSELAMPYALRKKLSHLMRMLNYLACSISFHRVGGCGNSTAGASRLKDVHGSILSSRLMIHVHERAAPDVEIPIIYEDRNFLAVSKPSSVDLTKNPGYGSVRLSVLGMLEEMGYTDMYPAHRIDKPVSGVLCLAKNKKALSRIMRCIRNRKVQKTYLARTMGGPDEGGFKIQAPLDVVLDAGHFRVNCEHLR